MIFKHTISQKATIKKKKTYDIQLTEEDISKAKESTFDNPYFKRGSFLTWYALYCDKGKIMLDMYLSHEGFEELRESVNQKRKVE